MPARQVFSAIVYVLRTGMQWKALPREFGSASAVRDYQPHIKQRKEEAEAKRTQLGWKARR